MATTNLFTKGLTGTQGGRKGEQQTVSTTVKQTAEVQMDESKVQELMALLDKSVAAYDKSGPYWPEGAEFKVYSYVDYIENRLLKVKKMPAEKALEASSAIWGSVAIESCDPDEVLELVKSQNPKLPGRVCAELALRIVACNLAREEAQPTYDDVLAFLGLEWAFEDGMPGDCSDPIDQAFLNSTANGDIEVPVISGYEDPFYEVDMSIATGPVTAEEARKLIVLAQTVNAARAGWRSQHNCQSPIGQAA